jgi:hypothetical protein
MKYRKFQRGLAWGYGLGLLSLLVVVGLMLWMTGVIAGTKGGPGGANSPTPPQAMDYARSTTQAVADQEKKALDDALNAANSTNAPAPPGSNGASR